MIEFPTERSNKQRDMQKACNLLRVVFGKFSILLIAGVYVAHALRIRSQFGGNACDDAFISFRYIDILVRYGELAYNPGERVEGFSNLLWILLLWPAAALGIDLVLASQVLGIIFGLLTICSAAIGLRHALHSHTVFATWMATGLLASSGYFAAWSILGLESTLHAFLLLSAWLRFVVELQDCKRYPISALLLGLLAMTRPEGLLIALGSAAIYAGKFVLVPGTRRHTSWWHFLVVLTAILASYELFRIATYGWHLWPNAVRAKVGLSVDQGIRGIAYVHDNFVRHYLFVLLPLAATWHFRRNLAIVSGTLLFLGSLVFVAFAGGDWSIGRFFGPLLPVGVVVFAGICDRMTIFRSLAQHAAGRVLLSIAILVACASTYRTTSIQGEQGFVTRFAGLDTKRVEFGKWLEGNTPPETSVGLYAAGQIAYFSHRYAHDMLGLNDAHISKLTPKEFGRGPAGHEKFDVLYTLETVLPDFLVQPHLIPGMTQHKTFVQQYMPLPGWRAIWVQREYWRQNSSYR